MRETKLDGLRLVLGDEACHMCDREGFEGMHVEFGTRPCPKCKGTGKRGSGNCRNCHRESWRRDTIPVGKVLDYDASYAAGPCRYCDGNRYTAMNGSSTLPAEIMREIVELIGVSVVARTGDMSWGEQHMGLVAPGSETFLALWSCVDYGRTWQRMIDAGAPIDGDTDELRKARITAELNTWRDEIAARIPGERVQVCKVARDDDRIIGSTIMLLLSRQGYTVVAANRSADERADILAAALTAESA